MSLARRIANLERTTPPPGLIDPHDCECPMALVVHPWDAEQHPKVVRCPNCGRRPGLIRIEYREPPSPAQDLTR